ncbi:MAG: tenascin-X [Myxococcaceae bacterium]
MDILLPSQYVGGEVEVSARVLNKGRSPLKVRWELPGSPFQIRFSGSEVPPVEISSGELPFTLRFKAESVGKKTALLSVRESDANRSTATVTGEGLDLPPCPTATQCHTVHFDHASGKCVEETQADGTECDPHSKCIEGVSTCQSGLCVGKTKGCDDGDACTLDLCNAFEGCQSVPAPPCPGDGKCQVGICNPQVGCGLSPADDGTRCGPTFTCDAADVCISGTCQRGDPPDGFKCQQESPCGEVGRCNGSVCEKTLAQPLMARFSVDSSQQPGSPTWGDFLLEPDGAMSTFGFFTTPRLRANRNGGEPGAATARRCLLWNNRLVCADFASNGRVSAVDLATGKAIWDFNVVTERPDYAQLARGRNLFMARLAEMGTDRLGALFEAYPVGSEEETQCRLYVLVVLNAAGKMITAQRIQDGLLDVCNHPHPYGFAADTVGNLFIAFSGTRNDTAPLQPDSPTLLMAYTRDGLFRWKQTDGFPGGELAVSRGVLYPEYGTHAYASATGTPLASVGQLGRVVTTEELVLPSPSPERAAAGTLLSAYDSRTFAARWSYPQTTHSLLVSDQLRIARWRPNDRDAPQNVALIFTQNDGVLNLTAVRIQDGAAAFSCPIGTTLRTAPQAFEVANGSLGLMENAATCGKCDPPFANSRAAFHTFALPGIEIADVPWPGTFGGASHDHHEDGIWAPPSAGN